MKHVSPSLSFDERERFAYITGDVVTANLFDEAAEAAAEMEACHADALDRIVDFMAARKGPLPKKAMLGAIRRYLEDPTDVSLYGLLDDIP